MSGSHAEPAANSAAVAQLRAAACVALERGAPDTAVAYLERALAEPPARELRPGVLRELARAQLRTDGVASDAVAHLRSALAASEDPRERAGVALELGDALLGIGQPAEAVRVFDGARDGAAENDRRLALLLDAHALGALLFSGASASAIESRRARIGRPPGTTVEERLALGVLAYERAYAGAPAVEVVSLARKALDEHEQLAGVSGTWSLNFAPVALVFAEAHDVADRVLARNRDDATSAANVRMLAIALCWRSRLAFVAGDVADAEADARAALDLARTGGWQRSIPITYAFLIDALLARDDLAGAEATLAASELSEEPPSALPWCWLLARRAELHLHHRRPREALDDLLECGRRAERAGLHSPAVLAWRGAAARAARAAGDHDLALALSREEVELARAAQTAGTLGGALRAAAAVATDHEGALTLLEEGLAVLEGSGHGSSSRVRSLTTARC